MSQSQQTFAVLVGVESYAAGGEWNLDGPASDACRFAKWLRERGTPKDRILLFLSPLAENQSLAQKLELDVTAKPATRADITDVFTKVLPQKSGDLLCFFWGGHGVIDAEGNRRLFYADADLNDLRHLNLNDLLTAWRTSILSGFPRQIGF